MTSATKNITTANSTSNPTITSAATFNFFALTGLGQIVFFCLQSTHNNAPPASEPTRNRAMDAVADGLAFWLAKNSDARRLASAICVGVMELVRRLRSSLAAKFPWVALMLNHLYASTKSLGTSAPDS